MAKNTRANRERDNVMGMMNVWFDGRMGKQITPLEFTQAKSAIADDVAYGPVEWEHFIRCMEEAQDGGVFVQLMQPNIPTSGDMYAEAAKNLEQPKVPAPALFRNE
jgi:hypothetical protein